MTRLLGGALGLIGCLSVLSGCASRDPYARTDVWYPTGANAANLAAMVANPNDLTVGRGDHTQPSVVHVMASDRIRNDQPRKLLGPGGGGESGGGGGGASGSGGGSQ